MDLRKKAAAIGGITGLLGVSNATAQSRLQDKFFGGDDGGLVDIASAGTGGIATASANGGAVVIGDVNSGGNAGSAIGVGDTWGGPVFVDGGAIGNVTDIGISASGGTAIADASGGDYNLAFVS
ncbi:MAG: hypothetical protein KY456_06470 [Chloroflexi bacterium]|nr:hypothetical protein [Chloroflexota bacterium]